MCTARVHHFLCKWQVSGKFPEGYDKILQRIFSTTFVIIYYIMRLSKYFGKSMTCGYKYFTKRFYSEKNRSQSVLKYVFVSESENIFENLALEDWLYENYDLSKREILLLWRNTPAVVIGRHQNPWLEANVEDSVSRGVEIVRRNSGGGTVYHDLGNLNLSFLTCRKAYDRVHNLEVIVKSLKKEWGVESRMNSRNDIMIGRKKISGTASKLSRKNAYHHCTLLVDVNRHILSTSLHSPMKNVIIDTNATASKAASTVNLQEINSSINIDRLITVIGREYLSTSNSDTVAESRGFHFVNPSNKYFSGLDTKISTFKSWNWIYGRTPKFTIVHQLHVASKEPYRVNFQIIIDAAIIKKITIDYDGDLRPPLDVDEHFNSLFLGKIYSRTILSQLENTFRNRYACASSKVDSTSSKC